MARWAAFIALVLSSALAIVGLSQCQTFSLGGAAAGDASDASDASDAGCGSTASDPNNCGSCGHSCLGGACDAGACAPFTVYTQIDASFYGIAVVPPYFFVANDQGFDNDASAIERGSLDGADVTGIAFPGTAPTGVAADETNVYYATQQDAKLTAIDHDGNGLATPTPLVPPDNGVARQCLVLSLDGKGLYFTYDNRVRTLPFYAPATAIEELYVDASVATGVATSPTSLFWTDNGDGTVWSALLDGGSPQPLANGQLGPSCMAIDGDVLYWTNSLGGKVQKWSIAGDAGSTFVDGEDHPTGIFVTADSIWWTAGSSIRRIAK